MNKKLITFIIFISYLFFIKMALAEIPKGRWTEREDGDCTKHFFEYSLEMKKNFMYGNDPNVYKKNPKEHFGINDIEIINDYKIKDFAYYRTFVDDIDEPVLYVREREFTYTKINYELYENLISNKKYYMYYPDIEDENPEVRKSKRAEQREKGLYIKKEIDLELEPAKLYSRKMTKCGTEVDHIKEPFHFRGFYLNEIGTVPIRTNFVMKICDYFLPKDLHKIIFGYIAFSGGTEVLSPEELENIKNFKPSQIEYLGKCLKVNDKNRKTWLILKQNYFPNSQHAGLNGIKIELDSYNKEYIIALANLLSQKYKRDAWFDETSKQNLALGMSNVVTIGRYNHEVHASFDERRVLLTTETSFFKHAPSLEETFDKYKEKVTDYFKDNSVGSFVYIHYNNQFFAREILDVIKNNTATILEDL